MHSYYVFLVGPAPNGYGKLNRGRDFSFFEKHYPGFTSATTATAAETTVKAETPFVDTWIGGWVGYDGTRKRGTGSWTVEKFDKGRYFIKPASGTVVNITATLMVDNGETKYICVTGYTKDGYEYVYIYDPMDNIFGSGTDGDFSFVASVEQ